MDPDTCRVVPLRGANHYGHKWILPPTSKSKLKSKNRSRNRETILSRERPVTATVSFCKSVVVWTQDAPHWEPPHLLNSRPLRKVWLWMLYVSLICGIHHICSSLAPCIEFTASQSGPGFRIPKFILWRSSVLGCFFPTASDGRYLI